MTDRFPASDFDAWADSYDQDVLTHDFPITGYQQVINQVVQQAKTRPGMKILDLGTGTGILAFEFQKLGCIVTGIDFSAEMLKKARIRLPNAEFVQADLHDGLRAKLKGRIFDRIVSAYTFHHFDLLEKVTILCGLVQLLSAEGDMIIADISFNDQKALEMVKQKAGDNWEEELFWIAEESLPALLKVGFRVEYKQISPCAGIYHIIQKAEKSGELV